MAGAVGKVINLGSGMSKKQDKLTGTAGQVVGFNAQGQAVAQTPAQVGMVPTTRKVNGKPLSADISLTASDVGARPNTWMPTAADVGSLTQTQGDGRYLKLSGGDMTGMLDMQNNVLTGLPAPVSPADAVNCQTLLNLIVGMADEPIVTVTGLDPHSNSVIEEFTASINNYGCFTNNDIWMSLNCYVSLKTITQHITNVSIRFARPFRYPKGDWSNLSGTPLYVSGSYNIPFVPTGSEPVTYEACEPDHISWFKSYFSVSGYIRLGMIG